MPTKYVPSIIQAGEAKCYLCGKPYNVGLVVHHAIPGTGNRKICTELGLTVYLCNPCHKDLHDRGIGYKEIQADAQRAFIKQQMKKGISEDIARDYWYDRFKKFYD